MLVPMTVPILHSGCWDGLCLPLWTLSSGRVLSEYGDDGLVLRRATEPCGGALELELFLDDIIDLFVFMKNDISNNRRNCQ